MSSSRTTDSTLRIVLLVGAVLVLAPMLTMVFVFPMMGMWGGMMGGVGGPQGGGFSPIWGLGMMLLWLVVLVGGGYLVYRWASGAGSAGADPALEELRLAYARGELSEDEYEERRVRLERE